MKVLQKAVRGLCARLRMLPSYRATQAQHDAGDESASSLAFDMAGDLECITELPEVLNCLKHAATLTEACFQREQARHAKADAERDANVAEEKRRLRGDSRR